MSFTAAVWEEAGPILRAIHAHPFVRELGEGSLSRERFREYMLQDALYLRGFARALAFGALKAPDAERILEFSKAAEVAIVVERALHAGFLQQFGVDPATAEAVEASPTCTAYVDHLIATAAVGGFGDLAAAVLPCFWIYQDVGARIHAAAAPANPYQAWIDTYAGEEFEAATGRMRAIVDGEGVGAGAAQRASMRAAFLRSCRYEWMFWDAAWRLESWPVAAGPVPAP
ncbi:MAG: thiaminase II [Pseudomonadota bacterium]|nr:thiaminase II [Pseudomonadota bacterium]